MPPALSRRACYAQEQQVTCADLSQNPCTVRLSLLELSNALEVARCEALGWRTRGSDLPPEEVPASGVKSRPCIRHRYQLPLPRSDALERQRVTLTFEN